MTDDRSERLRRRRKQSKDRDWDRDWDRDRDRDRGSGGTTDRTPAAGTTPTQRTGTDGASTGTSGRESDSGYGSDSIKEEQVGTYMYLPESQRKEMRRLYNVLKAEYEFEYDDEFEKNRHFYPLVVQFGLDQLDGLDASEIRVRLDEID